LRDIIGKTVWDFVAPEYIPVLKEKLKKRLQGEDIPPYEVVIINGYGKRAPFEVLTTALRSKKGEIIGIQGISRDITERKRAEEELRKAYAELETRVRERTAELVKARATLRAILDTAPIGIIAADAATKKITYYSRGARQMFGAPITGDVYGPADRSYQLLRPDGSPYPVEELPLALSLDQGKHVENAEVLIRKADGSESLMMASSAPIRDESGRITGAVVTTVDITRMKCVENELREAKAQAELYLDLMSHDINNINMMAIGYIEMAQHEIADTNAGRLLGRSMEMLDDISQLINNVRKLQRTEMGELKKETVDLCDVIRDAIKSFSSHPGRDVSIHFQPPDTMACPVTANRLLKDVFTNLIGNSIKHSAPDRPLAINVRVSGVREDETDYYRVSIEDNGPGIPDELKDRLFTRWQWGETKPGGKGLGLYLVKTLVEDYGGKVWVEDRVKGDYRKGSRFVVQLPARID
jgi:signal transduction histidine kinase